MKNVEIVNRKLENRRHSQAGFSLVEVMITVGILSVIALSSATMMSDMSRESARFRRVTERNNFEQKLVALYQKSDLCTCNLGGATPLTVADAPANTPITGLKSGCGTATNDVYQASLSGFAVDGNLKVMSIQISDPQFINATDYSATATITYDDHPTFGSLKPGRYSFMFTKPAASVAPYPVQTCTLGGSMSGGGASSGWSLSGNAGTGPADYVGTADDHDLFFRRNGVLAGMLTQSNTAFGLNSIGTLSGTNNTAVGIGALNGVTTGMGNVGIGLNTGSLASAGNKVGKGSNNTYIGTGSQPGDASEASNQTAIGYNAKAIGNNVMVLGGTGNDAVRVGIGTTTPTATLQVTSADARVGTIAFGDLNADMWFDGGNDSLFVFYNAGDATGRTQFDHFNQATNTYDKLVTIANSGNVGIGTEFPNQMLEVVAPSTPAASSAAAKGVSIRTQNGPIGGRGANFDVLLGGGDSNTGASGTMSVQNSTVAVSTSTLLSSNLVTLNTGGGTMVGGHFQVMDNVTSGTGTIIGSESIVYQSAMSGFGTSIGALGNATLQMSGAGTTGTLIGVRGMAANLFSGSTSEAMGGYFTADQGTGAFANAYGLYVGRVNGANKWSLYSTDAAAPSYFAGAMGIGVLVPTEKLHVVGNLRVQGSTDCTLGNGAGGTSCSSDIRLKNNVVEISNATEKIQSLRGVEFDWNEKARSPGRHDIGVIAQEVEKIFPTAVMTDSATGYKKVDYAVLVAPLIQAMNEIVDKIMSIILRVEAQDREIKVLKSELQTMKSEQQDLRARLEALEKRKE